MNMSSSVVFFKQTTAYDMRISDWISDVCSSDLVPLLLRFSGARIGSAFLWRFQRQQLQVTGTKLRDVCAVLEQTVERICGMIFDDLGGDIGELGWIGRASCGDRVCQ